MVSLTSPRGQAMLSWLPSIYGNSQVMAALLQGLGAEFDAARAAALDVLDQFFIDTASWTLDRWEAALGLHVLPGDPDDQRREKLRSQLRGTGTATIRAVQGVAQAYALGAVDVIEDYAAYALTIAFVDIRGVPGGLAGLQAILRAIVPVHLAVSYVFRYLLVSELTATGLTVDGVTALGFTVKELSEWRP